MNAFLKISLKLLFGVWVGANVIAVYCAIRLIAAPPAVPVGSNLSAHPGVMAFVIAVGTFLFTTLWLYGLTVIILTSAALIKPKTPGYTMREGHRDRAPSVSIVIPFKNEEHNLKPLLESIRKQSYKGEMEVIFVDDGSEDEGIAVIKKWVDVNDDICVKIIHLHDNDKPSGKSSTGGLTSKQRALDLGVSQSSHPQIAFTDADMILSPDWLESLVGSQISADADLVFGHTSVITGDKRESSLFGLLESFQLEFLFSFAYAFSKLNHPGSCMGNNMLIVKKRYEECDGQRGVGRSIVEDRALTELFRKKKFRVAAAEPFRVTAATYPARSKKQFFAQATRWARGGLRPGGGLFIVGILLLTQNAFFLLSALGTITGAIATQTTVNFILTWVFLAISFKKNGASVTWMMFPFYYIFMMIETFILGWNLIFKRTTVWKGRKI